MIIISDTSVITSLAAISHLHLLPELYDRLIIPEAVYRELVAIEPPVPGAVEVKTVPWLEVRQVTNNQKVVRLQEEVRLDPGESEAIATQQQKPGFFQLCLAILYPCRNPVSSPLVKNRAIALS